MNDRVCEGRTVLVLALAGMMILTGCATIRRSEARSTEEMLAAAGFVMRPADTAERQQRLAARPPYRLLRSPTGGCCCSPVQSQP